MSASNNLVDRLAAVLEPNSFDLNRDSIRSLAESLASAVEASGLIAACDDCGAGGHDLCDACDGTGRRAGGKCRTCIPVGSGERECPSCSGLGYITRDQAESNRAEVKW